MGWKILRLLNFCNNDTPIKFKFKPEITIYFFSSNCQINHSVKKSDNAVKMCMYAN